ncbi:phosphoribosylformylglycinamidine synthase [Caldimicrobium thiodismutans]|jgi:phosphoribosylformylglycinamidine synthase|uniref:Phosphoribosylformylglycinamidine synthase n=1 Tax=Caldimicrobium thiodismutans TaxID=1653476 RepID=A0A0U4W0B4_9BACT|nr:phosphoribosylformylglycinamidine synthase subunit PurQ [Caldimicrobium thiodismutans]BAU22603.1 phosphoribosylformylglycinamidine synthase [Caldimicrobium thiodismutans]
MTKVKVLVLWGYGINCEQETNFVFQKVGAHSEIVHLSEIFSGEKSLKDYHILCFPGGFLDGDHLGSAQACSHRFRYLKIQGKTSLWDELMDFLSRGGLILGICNGFQLLVKMGLLPGGTYLGQRKCTLTYNDSSRFEDRWVLLKVNPKSPCIFLKGLTEIYLPVRHGEGKFIPESSSLMEELKKHGQIALQYIHPYTKEPTLEYPFNPNGSIEAVAGLTDPTGRIFGLMPHPEAFNHFTNHPRWTRLSDLKAQGLTIFENAVTFVKENVL